MIIFSIFLAHGDIRPAERVSFVANIVDRLSQGQGVISLPRGLAIGQFTRCFAYYHCEIRQAFKANMKKGRVEYKELMTLTFTANTFSAFITL